MKLAPNIHLFEVTAPASEVAGGHNLSFLKGHCPPEARARPLEGQLSLEINECLGEISFEKAFNT
jgi:hypothetical protein